MGLFGSFLGAPGVVGAAGYSPDVRVLVHCAGRRFLYGPVLRALCED